MSSEDLWFIDYEQAVDDFTRDGDVDAFKARLRRLGFDPHEIENEVAKEIA